MKKNILVLVALGALVVLVGCDPFGSEKTMTYVTGTIYTDAAMTIPAEGIAVELVVEPDSASLRPQVVYTNVSGVFFMDIQIYPSLPDEEAGTGYTLPSTVTAGVVAHYGADIYTYASSDPGFLMSAGDTLTLWPISLMDFGGGSGGKL